MAIAWITIVDMLALIIGAIGAGMLITPATQVFGGVLVAIAAGIKAFQKKLEETNIGKIAGKVK
jgi:hypothetical protein